MPALSVTLGCLDTGGSTHRVVADGCDAGTSRHMLEARAAVEIIPQRPPRAAVCGWKGMGGQKRMEIYFSGGGAT